MKKLLFLLPLFSLMLVGCNKDPGGAGHSNVVKVMLSGEKYKSTFNNGSQFTDGTNVDSLISYCQQAVGKEAYLTSIEVSGVVNSLDDLNKDGNRYLTLGSAKSTGSLTWKCTEAIQEVVATVKNYDNTYTGGTGGRNIDRSAHFLINSNDFSLEIGEEDIPSFTTHTVTFSEDTHSFTISSTGGRVFVQDIQITWAN